MLRPGVHDGIDGVMAFNDYESTIVVGYKSASMPFHNQYGFHNA